DPGAAAIVRSTVDLAHSLGLSIVAEGVEDQAAAALLLAFGCDAAQGFLYAPAMRPAELVAWLDRRLMDGTGGPVTSAGAPLTSAAAAVPAPRPPGSLEPARHA
ncbi:MAG TPA: EAL domain-containing protein, partial [Actinotalea sp.]|nr:EAL domain-containing protein [Actinotalea sp.]